MATAESQSQSLAPIIGVLRLVAQLRLTLFGPVDCSHPGSSVHGDSSGKNTRVGCHALLQGGHPDPGIKSRSPTLQADSLPSELPGKQVYWIYIRLYQLCVDCLKLVDKYTDCGSELREIKF